MRILGILNSKAQNGQKKIGYKENNFQGFSFSIINQSDKNYKKK